MLAPSARTSEVEAWAELIAQALTAVPAPDRDAALEAAVTPLARLIDTGALSEEKCSSRTTPSSP